MPQADVVNTFPDSQRRRAPREMGRQPQRAPFMKRAASGGSWPDGQSAERERERERFARPAPAPLARAAGGKKGKGDAY